MARYRKNNFLRDNIKTILLGSVVFVVVFLVVGFFWRNKDKQTASPDPETLEDVYICGGCGSEYIGYFPYTSPWEEYPTEMPVFEITDVGETYNNGDIKGASPVEMFQRVTGNLSKQSDLDFYRFTVNVAGGVEFSFSFDGEGNGYKYLWRAAVYGPDGSTVLKEGTIPSEVGREVIFSVSDLEPGMYYLEIKVATGGNPLLFGYSKADYHITLRPKCAEHASVVQLLTGVPTCTQAGEVTSVCTDCGEVVSIQPLEPLDHIWSTWKTEKEILFGSPLGECSRTCALCGEVETEALVFHLLDGAPKTDPKVLTVNISQAASCGEEGVVETVCSLCGSVTVEHVQSIEHTYGDWVIIQEATCTQEGRRSRTCTACGHEETEVLERTPHTYGKAVKVSGSILDAPIVYWETCTQCGYVNTVESTWSRLVLPGILLLGIGAALVVLVLGVRTIRSYRKKASQKRRDRSFLCPYCFETIPIKWVQFRCTSHRCAQGQKVLTGKDIEWDAKGIPRSAECPDCRQITRVAICPKCRSPLPESTLSGEDMIISVVGSRDTGKSHFITVIINELIERIAPALGGSMEGFGDTMDHYTEHFKKQLYENLQCLKETDSAIHTAEGRYKPLIYSLKLQKKGFLGLGEKVRLYTLVFFDSAGEDMKSEEIMRKVNRYICKSSGIIFLLDPLKIPAVRAQLDEGAVRRASSADRYSPDDILVRVSNLIRSSQGMRSSDKIQVPVAAVFTKFDAIEPVIPRGCTVLEPSPHCGQGVFSLSDWHNVNAEVQGLLQTWGAESFLAQLKLNYKDYSCFTLSALGMNNNPDKNGMISRPHPHRIEDPLLWILMKRKVIKAKK